MSHGRRKPHNNFLNVYSYVEITGNGQCGPVLVFVSRYNDESIK